MHADINECAMELDDCSQQCNNTYGSYECTCFDGYVLSNEDCIGEYRKLS